MLNAVQEKERIYKANKALVHRHILSHAAYILWGHACMHASFYTWDGAVLGRANLLLFESSVLNLSKFQVPTNELTHCVLTNGHWICLILFYRSLFCKLIIQLLKNWNTNSIVYYWASSIQEENYVIETITRTVIKAERGREKLEHVKNHCFDDRNNSYFLGLGLFWKSWNGFFFLFFSFHFCVFWSLN